MKWIVAILLMASPVMADEFKVPEIPSEAEKIEALKLGFILNGMSMVRPLGQGSIDLTTGVRNNMLEPLPPPPVVAAEPIKPKGKAK
jgi:hypothetical protein